MSDEVAEKAAWDAWAIGGHPDTATIGHRVAFRAAWRARDAEVAELRRQLEAAKNVYPSIREAVAERDALREQLAAAEAVIEKVRAALDWPEEHSLTRAIMTAHAALSAARSTVLADVIREAKAEALRPISHYLSHCRILRTEPTTAGLANALNEYRKDKSND